VIENAAAATAALLWMRMMQYWHPRGNQGWKTGLKKLGFWALKSLQKPKSPHFRFLGFRFFWVQFRPNVGRISLYILIVIF